MNRKKLRRFETILWMIIKGLLYLGIMAIYIALMGTDNIALRQLSRTLGISLSTYVIVGLLFLSIYGKYDFGRRNSKPIIYSLALAVLFTDIISYLQLMIMNTVTPSIYAFRLKNIGLLAAAFILQLLLIIIAVYAGNALFFKLHPPEKCCVVTSSQEKLNEIVRGILT